MASVVRRFPAVWAAYGILATLANWLVLAEQPGGAHVAGAVLLMFVLPGAALLAAIFPRGDRTPLSERIVLSVGASAALTVILLWVFVFLPFELSLVHMTGAFDVVCLVLGSIALVRGRRAGVSVLPRREKQFLAMLALLAGFSSLMVLTRLNYGDLSGDERKPVIRATEILLGQRTSLYTLPRPPGQILLVMGIMRLGDSVSEGVLRLPFALMGVLAAAGAALIARSRLRLHLCALAGLLVISQGVLLEMSRWIQYQVFVLAMMELAFYCAWRAWATRHGPPTMRYWLLAAFFSAAGVLGHYDAAWMVPALVFLFVRAQARPLLSRRTIGRAVTVAAAGLLLSLPFYYAYLSYPGVLDSITAGEISGRVGLGAAPFNHFGDYLADMWDFDSAWRASVVLGLTVIGAAAAMLRAQSRFRFGLAALVTACFGGVLVSALQGSVFVFGGVNYAFVPFMVLCAALAWRVVRDPFWFAVLLWTFTVFGFTNFMMASPYDQYFLGLPALFLFACQGINECQRAYRSRFTYAPHSLAMWAGPVAAGIWLLASILYSYCAHIAFVPNRLTANPALSIFPFSQLASTRFQAPGYYVSAAGWRAVAVLYQRGDLRGENATSVEPVRDWYLSREWTPPTPAERYFIAAPPQKTYSAVKEAPADLATAYVLWGTILVDGDPQIKIYQRLDGQPVTARTLNAEDYESEWQQMATFSRLETFKLEHRNDAAFFALGRALLAGEQPGDAVAAEGQPARFLVNQYFTGRMPYVNPASTPALAAFRRIWGVFWANDNRHGELELATHTFPLSAQWIENVRLRTYAVAPTPALRRIGAQLGSAIHLTQGSILPATLRPGDVLPLLLQWHADAAIPLRYKVFAHVADARGAPAVQSDAEPVAELRPTTSWLAGETIDDRVGIVLPKSIQPGRYQVVVGMYAPSDEVRLAARSPEGSPYPNDAIPLGVIDVTPN